MIKNREDLMQVRTAAKAHIEDCDCRILVCSGTGCIATGSTKIYEEFLELVRDTPNVCLDFAPHDEGEHVGVKKTGCQGFCELGPGQNSERRRDYPVRKSAERGLSGDF